MKATQKKQHRPLMQACLKPQHASLFSGRFRVQKQWDTVEAKPPSPSGPGSLSCQFHPRKRCLFCLDCSAKILINGPRVLSSLASVCPLLIFYILLASSSVEILWNIIRHCFQYSSGTAPCLLWDLTRSSRRFDPSITHQP